MFIWRKLARPGWWERNESRLMQCYPALAAVQRPGHTCILLEVAYPKKRDALRLKLELGGSIKELPSGWLEHFARQAQTKPLSIGSRLIVRATPDKERRTRGARTIIIPAEAAFGTGEHATTAMCLRLLERHTRARPRGWSMLDAGTGSGILAIAARCLGAARVLAIDNDPLACAVAKRNARANGVRNIEFRTGDVLKLRLTEKFGIIIANLFSEILIKALPGWSRRLARRGFLILSGILRTQEQAVVSALRRNGFAIQEIRRRGKWIALLALPTGKKS